MTERALAILDRRIRESLEKSKTAKARGDNVAMFKMNTVFHWLNEIREEVAADDECKAAKRTNELG